MAYEAQKRGYSQVSNRRAGVIRLFGHNALSCLLFTLSSQVEGGIGIELSLS